jgi:ketosteroid isomerase-like protein
MSAKNVERAKDMWLGEFDMAQLVEGGTDRFAQVFRHLRPDVRSEFIAQNPEVSLTYEGLDGLYEGWSEWLAAWSSYVITMREVVAAGPDDVVLMGQAEARTSRDSVLMEHRPAVVLTFDDDGLVSRIRFFLDSADALRAAGVEAD